MEKQVERFTAKSEIAERLKGGVIMDVTTVGQARIAEESGAVTIMALERVPADIGKEGGGTRNLGEALRRIAKGAATIRTKGEAGTGNVVEAVRHMRTMNREIRELMSMPPEEVTSFAKANGIPYELPLKVKEIGRLPAVNFAAGGIATPADAALMMQLGCDGIFVGSGIFKSENPAERARSIVKATAHYNEPDELLEASKGLGRAMPGVEISAIPEASLLAGRGL